MSWGGKGKGWNCYTCGFQNWGTHCAECQNWGMKGAYPKGKGNKQQNVGDYPPHQMREDYLPQMK
eukprot:7857664-Heterocapsa_arctica.AAC.1